MLLAVVITTYRRRDGSTLRYLEKAIDSVFKQTYKNFRIFVVGDNYERPDELFDLCSKYDQKFIYCENIDRPSERDLYQEIPNAVWCYGGCSANNYAIQKAVDLGFPYICHLDHDDLWEETHLEEIAKCIEETQALWICTRSRYLQESNLFPPITHKNKRDGDYVEFYPQAERVIHSATCINYRDIPIRQTDVYKETGNVGLPGDAYTWERMREWLIASGKKSYLIDKVTCIHAEEGFEKSQRPFPKRKN